MFLGAYIQFWKGYEDFATLGAPLNHVQAMWGPCPPSQVKPDKIPWKYQLFPMHLPKFDGDFVGCSQVFTGFQHSEEVLCEQPPSGICIFKMLNPMACPRLTHIQLIESAEDTGKEVVCRGIRSDQGEALWRPRLLLQEGHPISIFCWSSTCCIWMFHELLLHVQSF